LISLGIFRLSQVGTKKAKHVCHPHRNDTFSVPNHEENTMRKSVTSAAVVAATVIAAVSLLSPLTAAAREGGSSRSIGNGVKCYTTSVLQANGTYKVEQVCRKGV
jgi:hypothetical protein